MVKFLLLGRAGSLPSGVRIFSGLTEDFRRGVGKLKRGALTVTYWVGPYLLIANFPLADLQEP